MLVTEGLALHSDRRVNRTMIDQRTGSRYLGVGALEWHRLLERALWFKNQCSEGGWGFPPTP